MTPAPQKTRRRVMPPGYEHELCGGAGAELDVVGQRRLGRVAVKLWRHLVDLRGWGVFWQRVAVKRLSLDTGIKLSAVKRAMGRLRDAGLVETDHDRRRNWSDASSRNFRSTLDVLALGAADTVRGREVLYVPLATVEWCAAQPGHGGYRHGARRDPVKMHPSPDDGGSRCTRGAPRDAGLGGQDALPKKSLSSLSDSSSPSEKKNSPGGPGGLFLGSREDGEQPSPRPPIPATRLEPPTLAEVYAVQARYLARLGKVGAP